MNRSEYNRQTENRTEWMGGLGLGLEDEILKDTMRRKTSEAQLLILFLVFDRVLEPDEWQFIWGSSAGVIRMKQEDNYSCENGAGEKESTKLSRGRGGSRKGTCSDELIWKNTKSPVKNKVSSVALYSPTSMCVHNWWARRSISPTDAKRSRWDEC